MFVIPVEPLFLFMLVLMRVLFFFAFIPVYGDPFMPVRVRVLLGVGVAMVFTPLLYGREILFPLSFSGFFALLVPEAL
ncbi:hypothetical protein HQ520_16020, partial [bacterium]|nr:hypothetical protein [bacterium]